MMLQKWKDEKQMKVMTVLNDYVDIQINDEIILHINHHDEGYSFDIYNKANYDAENYDEGYLTGTYVLHNEINEMEA